MDLASLNNQVATEQVQLMAAVKCIKAQQQTMAVANNIIQDTAEFSNEALELYKAECNKN